MNVATLHVFTNNYLPNVSLTVASASCITLIVPLLHINLSYSCRSALQWMSASCFSPFSSIANSIYFSLKLLLINFARSWCFMYVSLQKRMLHHSSYQYTKLKIPWKLCENRQYLEIVRIWEQNHGQILSLIRPTLLWTIVHLTSPGPLKSWNNSFIFCPIKK